MMLLCLFLLPFAATALALVAMLCYLPCMVAQLEAPYTPDMGDAEEWRASIDVALGEAWFDAPMPMTARKARSPRKVRVARRTSHGLTTMVCSPYVSAYPALRSHKVRNLATKELDPGG